VMTDIRQKHCGGRPFRVREAGIPPWVVLPKSRVHAEIKACTPIDVGLPEL
jgi:hypothetical protein